METDTSPGMYLMGITWTVSWQIGLKFIDIGYLEITHTSFVTLKAFWHEITRKAINWDSDQVVWYVERSSDNIDQKLRDGDQYSGDF